MERLRAILWARLALRINRPAPTDDRLLVTADAASRPAFAGTATIHGSSTSTPAA